MKYFLAQIQPEVGEKHQREAKGHEDMGYQVLVTHGKGRMINDSYQWLMKTLRLPKVILK